MPGRIDEIELIFLAVRGAIMQANALGFDGDAALFFQIHGVEHLRGHFALAERAGQFQQAIGKGRLAMVDVRDNAEVADEPGIHEGMFIPARGNREARHNERAKRLRIRQFDTIARERPEERPESLNKTGIFSVGSVDVPAPKARPNVFRCSGTVYIVFGSGPQGVKTIRNSFRI